MPPKIYTRTGDQGETGLFLGPRVGKDMPRIEVLGTLDELNALLGATRSAGLPAEIDAVLGRVQNELFALGAEISAPNPSLLRIQRLERRHVESLEQDIDRFSENLPPLADFILPGGAPAAAGLHLARTVCRRSERRLVTLLREIPEEVSLVLLAYLNRLADLLFVLARSANLVAGCPDTLWRKLV
ncbi:MAG: cob(I)yrinic acid a,c-diamide adenosyltransferase [Thermoguttaceae bacterium]